MDKYEFNIKVEQIKKLVNRGDYATAMKIADTIDWHRVRNASLLSMIAQIYEKNEEYQAAKDILLIAFERAPIGKRLLYKLAELALKEGSVDEATAYYKEFCELAQDDPRQYLLRYMILKAKKAPIEQLIRALETYTSAEVDEKWMYELAELYHKAGLEEKCVATCDTIMLLFGLGKYVDKAMDLKLEYAPLNKYQMDLVENRDKYEAKLRAVEEEYKSKSGRIKTSSVPVNETLEEEIPEEDVPEDFQEDSDPEPSDETAMDESMVIKLHEDEQSEMLAREMAKIAEENMPTASVEEDDMDATRALDDLHSIKEIKPTQRVLDAAAEREAVEAEREIERQRAAIRAAKEREEMEAEALRRAEEEREAARREEEERRAKRQAEIDRERASAKPRVVVSEEVKELEMEDEETSETYNLMIEAESEEEGLALAIEALKKIHKELGYKNPVAKIDSEKLNKKGILAVAEKLQGKDLLIEHAAGLTLAVQNELDELMEHDESGMIVVLIDTPKNLEALHAHHASLASKFQYIGSETVKEAAPEKAEPTKTVPEVKKVKEQKTEPVEHEPKKAESKKAEPKKVEPKKVEPEMDEPKKTEPEKAPAPVKTEKAKVVVKEEAQDVPDSDEYDDEEEMDPDEFAQFACKYASEIDCSIVDKSLLALYERIEMMEEDGVRLTQKAAVDLIEEAADKAEKKTFGRKIMSLVSPMYDKDGYLILREKDFFD